MNVKELNPTISFIGAGKVSTALGYVIIGSGIKTILLLSGKSEQI